MNERKKTETNIKSKWKETPVGYKEYSNQEVKHRGMKNRYE